MLVEHSLTYCPQLTEIHRDVNAPASAPARAAPCLTLGRGLQSYLSRYFFGASVLKTSLRIVARTFGSQPRASHLSRRTWAAIAKLSREMSVRQESLQSRSAMLKQGAHAAGGAKGTGLYVVTRFAEHDLPWNFYFPSGCFPNSM